MKLVGFFSKAILLFGLTVSWVGCERTTEKIAENYVMNLIIQNDWVVQRFEEGSNDITAEFSTYYFDFAANDEVFARKLDGGTATKGSWFANTTALTITSSFPVSAGGSLAKFNGEWNIDNTTLSSVNASRISSGITYKLYLVKKL